MRNIHVSHLTRRWAQVDGEGGPPRAFQDDTEPGKLAAMSRVRLAEVVRKLPRRAHDLTREQVNASQRWRMLEAVTAVTAKVGYAEMSVASVIAAAGLSRKTFYEHFRDREECFLSAYDVLSERLVESLVAVGVGAADPRSRRSEQLRAFLAALEKDRAIARVFMVDVLGAGAEALARRERVNARFADAIFGDGVEAVRRAAIVGGVNSVVGGAILRGRGGRLVAELHAPLAAFVESALADGR